MRSNGFDDGAPCLEELTCPFCVARIPANRSFLRQPTVRCWNCKISFAAPDSWRDCTEDFLKAGEARMREMADAYHACRLKQTGTGRLDTIAEMMIDERSTRWFDGVG
jgi:hypothetical protein